MTLLGSNGLVAVVIALGSNVGFRHIQLARAARRLGSIVKIVKVSSTWETDAIGSPPDSPAFLNAVVLGLTRLEPEALMDELLSIEASLGRVRRSRNAPRRIDLDLIFYGSRLIRTRSLEVPHPRFRERAFVLAPLAELGLPWVDPKSGEPLRGLSGKGRVRRVGSSFEKSPSFGLP